MNKIVQELRYFNRTFSRLPIEKMHCYNLAKNGQEPKALIITCSDSRVIPEKIFQLTMGEALVIRNAGGRITDDVLKDVEFFTHEFNTIELVVQMGHSRCGYFAHAVAKEIDIDAIVLESLRNSFKTEQEVIDQVTKMNVVEGVQRISKVIPKHIEICGAFYDIKTGIVNF